MHRSTLPLVRSSVVALLLSLAACGPESNVASNAGDESSRTEGALASTPLGAFKTGLITYYNATGAGACSFDASPQDLDVAAIAQGEYENSATCGACAEVQGPLGTVRVRIVDVCPGCTTAGHLDLSREAFAKIAKPVDGRVPVKWRFVSCPVTGSLQYRFKTGSSQYWTAIQVRNHALPVKKLEWKNSGKWEEVPRLSYNYFVRTSGMGPGSIQVRVTASNGQVLEDTLQSVQAEKTLPGKAQFAP